MKNSMLAYIASVQLNPPTVFVQACTFVKCTVQMYDTCIADCILYYTSVYCTDVQELLIVSLKAM